jgi:hypothetical protein
MGLSHSHHLQCVDITHNTWLRLLTIQRPIVFFELVCRLLASDNKDQPPLLDHLENHLIWVDSILRNMSLDCTVGSPSNPGYPFFTFHKNMVQLVIYTFDPCTMHCTLFSVLCSYLFSNQICLIIIIIVHYCCVRQEGSESASLPRRMEEVWEEEKNSIADVM